MTGEDGRHVCEAMLPHEAITGRCVPGGVIARQRQRNLGRLVRAMSIAAGTPGGAYQADVLRSYLACEGPRVARLAFYRWFDAPRARVMAALAERALAYARAQPVDLWGLLAAVPDGDSVDATTVPVRDALREEFPGPGADAALKVHNVLSVGGGAPRRDHVSPAREHESRHLQSAAAWQGGGLLAALASARLARLQACHESGVRCVIRRKDHGKPKVDPMARGQVPAAFFPGTARDAVREDHVLSRDGRAIDADGRVGHSKHPLPLRLLGVHTPKGDGFFLTTRPPRIGPRQVADLYRVRWEVERRITVDKSVHRLDQSDAERPCAVTTRLHASRMAAMSAALLAHRPHVKTRPPHAGGPRTEAPLPPRRLALPLAVSCQAMAPAFDRQGAAAKRRWQQIAAWLRPSGKAPNWRRRPSGLEQLRGWTRQPVVQTPANRRHIQAAASVDTYAPK